MKRVQPSFLSSTLRRSLLPYTRLSSTNYVTRHNYIYPNQSVNRCQVHNDTYKVTNSFNTAFAGSGRSVLYHIKHENPEGAIKSFIENPDPAGAVGLISALSAQKNLTAAFDIYEILKEKNIQRDVFVFGSMIIACQRAGDFNAAFTIYEDMKGLNIPVNNVIFNTLAKCAYLVADVKYMRELLAVWQADPLSDSIRPDERLNGSILMIKTFAKLGTVDDIAATYEVIIKSQIKPTIAVFGSIIMSLKNMEKYTQAIDYWKKMIRFEIQSNLVILGAVAQCCSKSQDASTANQLFTYIKDNQTEITVDTVLCNFLIEAIGRGNRKHNASTGAEDGLKIINFMVDSKIPVAAQTYGILLRSCESSKDLETGKIVHGLLNESKSPWTSYSYSSLIRMYTACSYMAGAEDVWQKFMKERNNKNESDVVVWNNMFYVYIDLNEPIKLLELYDDLLAKNIKPVEPTYTAMFLACTKFPKEMAPRVINIYCDMEKLCAPPMVYHQKYTVRCLVAAGQKEAAKDFINNVATGKTRTFLSSFLNAGEFTIQPPKRLKYETEFPKED